MEIVSPIVSVIALAVSLFTAWFTIFRRGTVCATHPSFIAFRYDFIGKEIPQAKIFLRTLLFSTGKRGWVVESLFLRVSERDRCEEFSFWGYGDKELVRGSGIFVPENGIVTYHHFNPLHTEPLFCFSHGTYKLELVAKLVGEKQLVPLWVGTVEIPSGAFDATIDRDTAVFFSWSAEQGHYVASIEKRSGHIHTLADSQS